MIGMANEAVFPVPVCAQPNISLFANAAGIAFSWIGVGTVYPFSLIAFKIGSVIFNSLNVINVVFAISESKPSETYLI